MYLERGRTKKSNPKLEPTKYFKKKHAPPPYIIENFCINLHHIMHVHYWCSGTG